MRYLAIAGLYSILDERIGCLAVVHESSVLSASGSEPVGSEDRTGYSCVVWAREPDEI